jgi:2-keto-4-pentenoate hydratase
VWIGKELSRFGNELLAGEVVTTGTIITPVPVGPPDRVRIDFDDFGAIEAGFS